MGRLILIVLLFSFVTGRLYAQKSFELKFPSKENFAFEIVSYLDGGYVVFDSKNYVFRFNSCNQLIWGKKISNFDGNIIATHDNGLIIYGPVPNNITNKKGVYFSKLDSAGNIQWSKAYPNLYQQSWPFYPIRQVDNLQITATRDSGYILTCSVDTFVGTNRTHYIFLSKLDKKGNTIWSRKYLATNLTIGPEGILQLNNSNEYIVFCTYARAVIRFDESGNVVSAWSFTGVMNPNVFWSPPIVDSDDKLLYAGIYRTSNNGFDIITMKSDIEGKMEWYNRIPRPGGPWIGSTFIFGNNGELIFPFQDNFERLYLTSLDRQGNLNWSNFIEVRGLVQDLSLMSDSGFIFSTINSNGHRIVKLDKMGTFSCGWKDTTLHPQPETALPTKKITFFAEPAFHFKDTVINAVPAEIQYKVSCSSQPIPNIYLPNNTAICTGYTLTLKSNESNPGCSLLWSTGDTTESITVTQSGRYWLQSSYGFCQSSDTIEVIFREQLKSKMPDTVNVCPYDSFELVMPDTTLNSLYWVTPLKDASGNFITRKDKRFWAKDKGAYYLKTSLNTPCPVFDTVQLTYYELPEASAGPDTMLCFNQEYTMQGSGGVTYKWTPANYLSSDSLPDAKAMLPVTQAYKLIVRNEHGCSDTSDVLLEVRPPLKAALKANETAVCKGSKVMLSASGIGGLGEEKFTFHWPQYDTTGESIIIEVTESAWHKILLSDGCSPDAEDSIYIEAIPHPVAAFSIMPADPKAGQEVIFRNSSNNAKRYYWSFGDGSTSTELSPSHIYLDSNMYEVRLIAIGRNGCSDTTSQKVLVISDKIVINIPNIFTPNDDGVNDVFTVSGAGIKDYTLSIYSRWGQQLLTEQTSWNGSINNQGELVHEGVYLYTIKVQDLLNRAHYLSGEVTVSY